MHAITGFRVQSVCWGRRAVFVLSPGQLGLGQSSRPLQGVFDDLIHRKYGVIAQGFEVVLHGSDAIMQLLCNVAVNNRSLGFRDQNGLRHVARSLWFTDMRGNGESRLTGNGLRRLVPTPNSHQRPDRLDHSERPGALQKAVDRTQGAGRREPENESASAILQRIAHQHGRDGEQSEQCEAVHKGLRQGGWRWLCDEVKRC